MASREHEKQASPSLGGLIALNAILLIILAAVTLGPSADAQSRGRGDYTMVAGGVNGSESAAVYIVDANNQELIGIAYDVNTKKLQPIGYKNLAADAAAAMRGRPGN